MRVLWLRIPTPDNRALEQHGDVLSFSQVTSYSFILQYTCANSNQGTTKKPVMRWKEEVFQKEEMKLFEGDVEHTTLFF